VGMFDYIKAGDRLGQVKCWERMLHTYAVDDIVPDLDGHHTYDISMREGGFVHIVDNRLLGWGSVRWRQWNGGIPSPVFDKYGDPYTPDTKGELDEVIPDPYLWRIDE
jgi:hypothetical protein